MLNKDTLKRKEDSISLDYKIKSCKDELYKAKEKIESIKSKLKCLQSKYQPKTKDVLSDPESYINFEIKISKYYKFIQSHRDISYSHEQVDGNVAFVKVKKEYFLSEIQKELIKTYIISVYEVKDCRFED